MRLSIILMTCFLLQVSASSLAQRITLKSENITLKNVFQQIRKQTGYVVLAESAQINKIKPFAVNLVDVPLESALERILKGQELDFSIEEKTIVIKKKEKSLLDRVIAYFTQIDVTGKVVDEKGEPIAGATIRIKGTSTMVIADAEGRFILKNVADDAVLEIISMGYTTREVKAVKELGSIQLGFEVGSLEEVNIVNTGYQSLSKERATGSFVLVDSTLINRSVSTGILDRLDGVTSGLLTTKSSLRGVDNKLMIRGRSTLFGEEAPLIIVDNFPFDGDLENINPNDVKSITLLKDAAASSIWGTRAGNGVIVITTFKGNYQSKQRISLNTNVNIGAKPDLYQAPWFTSAQWLDIEQFLFNKGAYNTVINNGYGVISPAVEMMNQRRRNEISAADSLRLINELKQYDVRGDMLKYLYRPSVNQQYALNISGGGDKNRYFVSAGYDHNRNTDVTDSYRRFTFNTSNTYKLLKDKMEISAGINFTSSKSLTNNQSYRQPGSPYERLIDGSGTHLAIRNGLRLKYIDTVGKGRLLDWHYRPLDELEPRTENVLTSYLINLGADYTVLKGLKLSLLYQMQKQTIKRETDYDEESFFTRDLINRISKINTATNSVVRPIPLGGILDHNNSQLNSNKGRFQVNYSTLIDETHQLNAIAGTEIRDTRTDRLEQRMYGFNPDLYTNANATIDFTRDYSLIYNPASSIRLDARQSSGYALDRYFSYFGNLAYSYKQRYTLTASARKDESNLFGVKPNQRGVPLWSTGLLWGLNNENFYKLDWLPVLRLRASFGYSGNVNKSLSAYLTAAPDANNVYGAPVNIIVNPPNPSLRWERVKIVNVGLDFSTNGNRISGSIEPYVKEGIDLFGDGPLAPQTGKISYRGNTANTNTKGLDLSLNTLNIDRAIKWSTNFLFSSSKQIVTRYLLSESTNSLVITATGANPIVGNPYYSIYAYKWAGLDQLGDPQAFLNGVPSKNYAGLANSLDRNNIRLMGSSVPTKFGNIRNTLSYKDLELSFNITYRLGYSFRRNSLNNGSIYTTSGFASNVDYEKQWAKPGDEAITSVPILRYPNVATRSNIYTYADILVERADNIRLQDIRLNWNLGSNKWVKRHFSNLQVYCYANQLGYIWKANKLGLDPDVPRPDINITSFRRTIAFGLKADF